MQIIIYLTPTSVFVPDRCNWVFVISNKFRGSVKYKSSYSASIAPRIRKWRAGRDCDFGCHNSFTKPSDWSNRPDDNLQSRETQMTTQGNMTPIICFSRSEDKFIFLVTPPVQGANESAELVNYCWLGRAAPVFAWLVSSAARPRSVSVDIKTDTPSPPQF